MDGRFGVSGGGGVGGSEERGTARRWNRLVCARVVRLIAVVEESAVLKLLLDPPASFPLSLQDSYPFAVNVCGTCVLRRFGCAACFKCVTYFPTVLLARKLLWRPWRMMNMRW